MPLRRLRRRRGTHFRRTAGRGQIWARRPAAVEADYTLPVGLDATFEKFVLRRNELEADVLMENLKARLEV